MLSRIFRNINTLSVLLLPDAKAGDSEAQFNLAQMLESGRGGEMNPVKAVEWYQDGML
jgi:TPR repeat protein